MKIEVASETYELISLNTEQYAHLLTPYSSMNSMTQQSSFLQRYGT
jgi:hypothetical protein